MATIRATSPVSVPTVTNLVTNPSFETSDSPWTAFANNAVTRTNAFPLMAGRVGFWVGQSTATGAAPQIGFNSDSVTIDPTKWYGWQFWCATDTSLPAGTVVRAQMRFPADGAAVFPFVDHPADSGQFAFYPGGFARQVLRPEDVAPGVTSMRLQPNLDALNPGTIPTGKRLWMDQVILVEGESEAEVEAALDAGYFDGDTPGAHWNGTPHASTSSLDYVIEPDLVLDYGYARGSRNVVLEPLGSGYPTVFQRTAQSKAGTLRLLFHGAAPARTAGDAFSSINRFHFQAPEVGEDWHFIVTGAVNVKKVEGVSYWTVDVEFREVEPL